MSKKNFFIAVLQVIIIGAFIMIAAGSGTDAAADYQAGYKIGQGVGALINN